MKAMMQSLLRMGQSRDVPLGPLRACIKAKSHVARAFCRFYPLDRLAQGFYPPAQTNEEAPMTLRPAAFHLDRRATLATLAGLLLPGSALRAETFPAKPITLVVPYPAGGPTDVIARIVAGRLEELLRQKVLVENKAGASGAIGSRQVATAAPDGYTIVFGNNQTHGNNMILLKEPGYDAITDFAPLAGVGAFPHVLVVKKDLPAKTVQEFVALAKASPGKLNYGSTGVGSGSHLAFELLMTRAGIRLEHIPYKGAAPLTQDIIGGRIDASLSTLPSVLKLIEAGEMRAIGIASPERAPQLKDVPTFREQGIANADADSWAAFFAPAKTPADVRATLAKALADALETPSVAERITALGFALRLRTPREFAPYLEEEIRTWRAIITAARIEAQ
jgi:tripartite-type tricarboxylate transporter receptor subunit TctC